MGQRVGQGSEGHGQARGPCRHNAEKAPPAARTSVSEGVQAWWQGRVFQLLLPRRCCRGLGVGMAQHGRRGDPPRRSCTTPLPQPPRLPPELLPLLLRLAGGELGHRLGALRHGVLGQLACMARWGWELGSVLATVSVESAAPHKAKQLFVGSAADPTTASSKRRQLAVLRHSRGPAAAPRTGQDEAHGGLDLAAGDGRLLVVARQVAGLHSNLVEDILHATEVAALVQAGASGRAAVCNALKCAATRGRVPLPLPGRQGGSLPHCVAAAPLRRAAAVACPRLLSSSGLRHPSPAVVVPAGSR